MNDFKKANEAVSVSFNKVPIVDEEGMHMQCAKDAGMEVLHLLKSSDTMHGSDLHSTPEELRVRCDRKNRFSFPFFFSFIKSFYLCNYFMTSFFYVCFYDR